MGTKFCYKSTLKNVYGLTDALIRLIGPPDKETVNPHYRTGPRAALYSLERVEAWIEAHSTLVEKARQARIKRSARMSQVAQKKRADTLVWANTVEVKLSLPPRVREDAAAYYAQKNGCDGNPANWSADKAIIAYARHRHTNYEVLLSQLSGRVGATEGYEIIRERVDTAIKRALEGMA